MPATDRQPTLSAFRFGVGGWSGSVCWPAGCQAIGFVAPALMRRWNRELPLGPIFGAALLGRLDAHGLEVRRSKSDPARVLRRYFSSAVDSRRRDEFGHEVALRF